MASTRALTSSIRRTHLSDAPRALLRSGQQAAHQAHLTLVHRPPSHVVQDPYGRSHLQGDYFSAYYSSDGRNQIRSAPRWRTDSNHFRTTIDGSTRTKDQSVPNSGVRVYPNLTSGSPAATPVKAITPAQFPAKPEAGVSSAFVRAISWQHDASQSPVANCPSSY